MRHFIYLHGFNSAYDEKSEKIIKLQSLGTVSGITYDTNSTYDDILEYLLAEVNGLDMHEVVFVGTSLGGFWAAVLASKLSTPSIIINPCYNPTDMLYKHVGDNTNYKTGKKASFSESACLSYKHIQIQDLDFAYKPLVLLDMGDEIIDSVQTSAVLFDKIIQTFDGGSHRFDHMGDAIEHISKYTNWCSLN